MKNEVLCIIEKLNATIELNKTIVSLIQKQVETPILIEKGEFYCPVCRHKLDKIPNYCENCGQKLGDGE